MEAALVEACRAAPDDDGPREVLADALGGERGEFVMLQLALAGGEGTNDQRRRARQLARQHGAAWSELEGLANRVTFRRGFVDAIEVKVGTLVERAAEIFARAPLCEHVLITDLVADARRSVFVNFEGRVGELEAALANLPRLRGLFVDSLATIITQPGALDDSFLDRNPPPIFDGLGLGSFGSAGRVVAVRPPPPRRWFGWLADAAHDAFAGAIAMRCGTTILDRIPASVAELELERAPLHRLDAPQLERLTCDLAQVFYQPLRFASYAALRSLTVTDLARPHVDAEQAIAQWSQLRLPALRELRGINLSEAAAFAIAKRFGPQLRLLDLRGSAAELYLHHAELQALVAGDVVTGGHVEMRPISWLGRRPRELMWDHPLVELRR